MTAALPMYFTPETRDAHDALWALIRDGLRDRGLAAPDSLDHEIAPADAWAAPDLVLSHICNLPYRKYFRDRVTLIGASDYGLEGCAPGQYRSLFVVRPGHPATRPEELDGARFAYNEADSQSGWGAAALWSRSAGIRLNPVLQTGAHRHSIAAVAQGEADAATIDAQSFRILGRTMDEAARVRVIGATPPSPGISFITRKGEDPAPYAAAIAAALEALAPVHRSALALRGIVRLSPDAYDLPIPPSPGEVPAPT